jgi:hypothetical protein
MWEIEINIVYTYPAPYIKIKININENFFSNNNELYYLVHIPCPALISSESTSRPSLNDVSDVYLDKIK